MPRKKPKGLGMDPLTACANVIAALLNYATEVRRTMTPDAREAFDKMVLADLAFWRKAFGIDKD
jgi:hypothetical protein